MMRLRILIELIAVAAVFTACNSGRNTYREIQKNGLRVQLGRFADHHGEAYRIRLIPENRGAGIVTKTSGIDPLKNMDSCFYMLNGKQKIYPVAVQFIASGSETSFEYVAVFNDSVSVSQNTMIYEDKYINRKTYRFDPEVK
ncbi:hypothetical protein AAFN85_13800 [Mucilaginibacter sp. CAU 1740]|uniref:hypothetical protein n=1 Tax=Mucilaginibacter sp. CAU 1740 TaxID=3140365 RepID=UPI00325AB584